MNDMRNIAMACALLLASPVAAQDALVIGTGST